MLKLPRHHIRSIYGCHSVSSGQFEWRLNLKKIGPFGICVGIIHDEKVRDYLDNYNYDLHGDGAFGTTKVVVSLVKAEVTHLL